MTSVLLESVFMMIYLFTTGSSHLRPANEAFNSENFTVICCCRSLRLTESQSQGEMLNILSCLTAFSWRPAGFLRNNSCSSTWTDLLPLHCCKIVILTLRFLHEQSISHAHVFNLRRLLATFIRFEYIYIYRIMFPHIFDQFHLELTDNPDNIPCFLIIKILSNEWIMFSYVQ